ncbi:MAG: proline racemase family protein [Desulfosarcinaceae bacterium]
MLDLQGIAGAFQERYPDRLLTIDSHTQGEPTRLLVGGVGHLPGGTMLAKQRHFEATFDAVRRQLTREPRGHRGIMAAVVTEPVSPKGDFGLFYMDARRYPYLCGHATIGAVASLVEIGALSVPEGDHVITVDTPSGPMDAHTRIVKGLVVSVAIDMVPSFVFDAGLALEIGGYGRISVDLVCVGGFFAMVDSREIGIELSAQSSDRLIPLGMTIIDAANRAFTVHHPERPEVTSVDVTEFYEDAPGTHHGRGVVIYGESHMDRSPCGTGTAAKMTLLHHRGALKPGDLYRNTSPLGTVFEGRIIKTVKIGPFNGVVAQIRGNAQITGFHQFVQDPRDPFPEGFLL